MDVMLCSATHFLPNVSAITGPASTRVVRFSAVWNAIVNHPIVENPENPRLWSLHGGIKWIGGVQELYNRPCYDEITKEVSSVTHALVFGTPGIGKTLYLQVLLVHLFRRAKEEGRDIPTIHYMYQAKKKVVTLSFLSDGSVVDITDFGRVPDPEYLLSDSVDIENADGTILNLEVASDKDSNYNIFEKRVEEACKMGQSLVMPLFSFHELRSIQPADMDDWCAEFRHDVFGGSARNFKSVQERNFDVLPVVDETLTLMFPDVKDKHYDAWDSVARQVSAKLTGKAPDVKLATVNSMMRHMLSRGSKTWASKFMEWLAAAIVDDRTADIVDELERVIGKAGLGILFETVGHRKLLRSTVPFLLKPLSASLSPTKPAFESAQFNLSVVRFKTVDDIAKLPNGTYGVPLTNNFPVADAIIQPDTIVQFTISPEMHKGSLEQLAEIRKRLWASPKDHRIIFVIPPENINTFRYHPKLAGIRQLVCAAEPSVVGERSLMSEEEKIAGNVTGKGARRKTSKIREGRKDLKDPPPVDPSAVL